MKGSASPDGSRVTERTARETRRLTWTAGQVKLHSADEQADGPRLPIQMALIQAHQGMAKLISGKATTMREIAKEYKMDRSFVARTLQLANLAPDIVKAIWENRQPVSLTLDKLRRGIPDSWEEQRKLFPER